MMKIEVWSDYACPFCYIGKQRLQNALDQFPDKDKVEVEFKSFELDPRAPKQTNHDVHDMLSKKYGMSREQAIAMNSNLAGQAKETGLEFQFDTLQLANTFDAHRLTRFAASKGRMDAMAQELFRAYFTDSLLLSDHDTLADLAEKAGLDRQEALEALAGPAYTDEVRADEEEARQLGVTGVPFFVFDRKYAVSGAQSQDAFLQTLQQVWNEAQQHSGDGEGLNPANSTEPGGACRDDACDLP